MYALRVPRAVSALAVAALLAWASACTTARSDLHTAQVLYKDARYEEAQLWLSQLETQLSEMGPTERTRFHYLRGMTAFRLGQREDALHYLVLADELIEDNPQALPAAWKAVLKRTLAEMTPTSASPHARNPLRPDTF